MTIQEILDYIAKTPENANVNVLSGMLDELTSGGGSEGGGDITVEALSVTENGTYTAEAGKAYSPVTVNVPSDFSKGTVSITDNRTAGDPITFVYSTYFDGDNSDPSTAASEEQTIMAGSSPVGLPVILYKGATTLVFTDTPVAAITITGAEYEWSSSNQYLILKGSCEIEINSAQE